MLELPNEFALVHLAFHVSILKKFVGDSMSIRPLEGLTLKKDISYDEVPDEILDIQFKKFPIKEVASVEVL